MKKITRIVSVLAIVFCQSAIADVDELLLMVAEAYGGQARITEVSAYLQSGVTFSTLHGEEGRILRSYRHPDHLRVEIEYGGGDSELRILAGPYAWKQNQPAEGVFYSAMLLQAARLGLPALLFEYRKLVQDAGTMITKLGRKLPALELNFHGRYRLLVGIDPKSGRILESRGILTMNSSTMEFGTTYDDFRFKDGRMFAFKEEHYAMGQKTGYTHIKHIEILPNLPDVIFSPSESENTKPGTTVLSRKKSGTSHNS